MIETKGFNLNDLLGEDAHKSYNKVKLDLETNALTVLLEDGSEKRLDQYHVVENPISYAVENDAPAIEVVLIDPDTEEIIAKASKTVSIGCSQSCDITLVEDKKSHTISRHHASIFFLDEAAFLEDKSTNGTFIATMENPTGLICAAPNEPN